MSCKMELIYTSLGHEFINIDHAARMIKDVGGYVSEKTVGGYVEYSFYKKEKSQMNKLPDIQFKSGDVAYSVIEGWGLINHITGCPSDEYCLKLGTHSYDEKGAWRKDFKVRCLFTVAEAKERFGEEPPEKLLIEAGLQGKPKTVKITLSAWIDLEDGELMYRNVGRAVTPLSWKRVPGEDKTIEYVDV